MWRHALVIALLLGACGSAFAQIAVPAATYLDKLQGMWLGELIGNYAGRTIEGTTPPVGGLYYSVNWTDPNHVDPASGARDYVFRDASWDGDDDTCFEYLNMNFLRAHPDPSGAEIGQLWAGSMPDPAFYIANRQARHLLSLGYAPPATGSIHWNAHWAAIDSQITTESLGAVAPGMIQRAADLAGRFGSVTNDGYALHAAEYYAAMYSAAATETNVEKIVALGQKVVPTTSRTWKIIQDVRDWYEADKADGNLDWRSTQGLLYNRYYAASNGRYRAWYESSINTAMTTLAILYGGGDFQKTVEIAVQGGFDADCNPATAGGLVGMIQGYSGLPADLRARASSTYVASSWISGVPREASLEAVAAGFQADAEAQILLMGGSITGDGAARTYHIPNVPLSARIEKPDPAGPKGLVGQVLALGGKVSVTASVAQYNPADDRANLPGIIDGITDVSYDGHLPYSTYDGSNHQPAGGDYYQLTFDRPLCFSSVVFYEGDMQLGGPNSTPDANDRPPRGGWFTDLSVEVAGSGGGFVPVTGLSFSEPLDPYKLYQVITMTFAPVEANAIRVRGTAGGVDEFTTCVELEAYGFVPGAAGNQWNPISGLWSDGNCWTMGVPGGGLGAVVGNGGTVAINQPGLACDTLTLGERYRESGVVSMTGGRLDSNWVVVGLGGAGSFTQSGGVHVVRCGLLIGQDGNGAGAYVLLDGNLCVGGGLFVGGSPASAGGVGELTVSGGVVTVAGGVRVWGGGSVHLGGGTLVSASADGNAPIDIENSGLLDVSSGMNSLGEVTGIGDALSGSTVIGAGATLTVKRIVQDSLVVEGTLVLGGDDSAGWALQGPDAAMPEPSTLAVIGAGVVAMGAARKRKRWSGHGQEAQRQAMLATNRCGHSKDDGGGGGQKKGATPRRRAASISPASCVPLGGGNLRPRTFQGCSGTT
jgi:hypothetical protein